jgi:hypothetical protein
MLTLASSPRKRSIDHHHSSNNADVHKTNQSGKYEFDILNQKCLILMNETLEKKLQVMRMRSVHNYQFSL